VTITDDKIQNPPSSGSSSLNGATMKEKSSTADSLFERKFKLSGLTIKKSTDNSSSSVNIEEILKYQQKEATSKAEAQKSDQVKKPFIPEAFKNISISKVGVDNFNLNTGSTISMKRSGLGEKTGDATKKARVESVKVTLEEEEDSEYEEEEGTRVNMASSFENCTHGSLCDYICTDCMLGRWQAEWDFVQPRQKKVKPVPVKEPRKEPSTEDPISVITQVDWQSVFKFAGVPVVEEVLLE